MQRGGAGFVTLSCSGPKASRLLEVLEPGTCRTPRLVFSPQVMNPLPEGWEEQRNQRSFAPDRRPH